MESDEDGATVGQLLAQFAAPSRSRKQPSRPKRLAAKPQGSRGGQRRSSTQSRGRRSSLVARGSQDMEQGQRASAGHEQPVRPRRKPGRPAPGAPQETGHSGEVQGEGHQQRKPSGYRGRRRDASGSTRSAAQAPAGVSSRQPAGVMQNQVAQRPLLPLLPYPAAYPVHRGHPSPTPLPGVPPLLPATAHPGQTQHPSLPRLLPSPAGAMAFGTMSRSSLTGVPLPGPQQAGQGMSAAVMASAPAAAAAAAGRLQPQGQGVSPTPWAPSFALSQLIGPFANSFRPAQREELISLLRDHTQLLVQVCRGCSLPGPWSHLPVTQACRHSTSQNDSDFAGLAAFLPILLAFLPCGPGWSLRKICLRRVFGDVMQVAALAQGDLAKHRLAAEVTRGLLTSLVQTRDQFRALRHPPPTNEGAPPSAGQAGCSCLDQVPALDRVSQFLGSLTVPGGPGGLALPAPLAAGAPQAAQHRLGGAKSAERRAGDGGGGALGVSSAGEEALERAKEAFREHLVAGLSPSAPDCPQTLCKFTPAEDR